MAKFLGTLGLSERYSPVLYRRRLGGILHLKSTVGCQMSTSILGLDSIHISCKISNEKVLAHLIKCLNERYIALTFKWLKCVGGIVHLKSTAGGQISTSILVVDFINISCKFPAAKFLPTRVLPWPLNDLSACVWFCAWIPQQSVKCQLQY